MKKRNCKAFTLAEVLIALAVIGVVSALTIPTLVQKTNKQEYVSALQKAYSTLSQATNMIIAENGSPKCDDGGWACSEANVYNLYKKYLNNVKECDAENGCINQGRINFLDKSGSYDYTSWGRKLILADGMQVLFYYGGGDYSTCSYNTGGTAKQCAEILVDVNGEKKPNTFGRDVFYFVIKENGLYPVGCDYGDYCTNTGSFSGSGCACKVLREGRMDY